MIFDFNSQRHFDWLLTYSTNTSHKSFLLHIFSVLLSRLKHTQLYSILDRESSRFNNIQCTTSKIHYHLIISDLCVKWQNLIICRHNNFQF